MDNETAEPDTNPATLIGPASPLPVALGVGAAGGVAIGAAMGGRVGAVVGAAVGAVAGGLIVQAVARKADVAAEEAYWRENHAAQSFAGDHSFDALDPAYRTGYEGFEKYSSGSPDFEAAEPSLQRDYERLLSRSSSSPRDSAQHAAAKAHITWTNAKQAARAAWDRVQAASAVG